MAMDKTFLISFDDCCRNYSVDLSFIDALEQHGLINTIHVEEQKFIEHDHLRVFEQYLDMYYEIDINLEGLEVISRLLDRINSMQNEIVQLKNRIEYSRQ